MLIPDRMRVPLPVLLIWYDPPDSDIVPDCIALPVRTCSEVLLFSTIGDVLFVPLG